MRWMKDEDPREREEPEKWIRKYHGWWIVLSTHERSLKSVLHLTRGQGSFLGTMVLWCIEFSEEVSKFERWHSIRLEWGECWGITERQRWHYYWYYWCKRGMLESSLGQHLDSLEGVGRKIRVVDSGGGAESWATPELTEEGLDLKEGSWMNWVF